MSEAQLLVSNYLSKVSGSGPVTEEALRGCIAELSNSISSAKAQLYDSIRSNYAQFQEVFSLSRGVDQELKSLHIAVQDLISAVSDPKSALRKQLTHAVAERDLITRQITTCDSTIKDLQTLSNIESLFSKFDEVLDEGEYQEAAQIITQISEVVGAIAFEGPQTDEIVTLIKQQVQKKQSRLRFRLFELLKLGINFESANKLCVTPVQRGLKHHQHESNPVNISTIFSALETQGQLQTYLKQFCSDLLNNIVEPALQGASIESNSENGMHELCVVSNASAPKVVSADDWVQRLLLVQEILQFVWTHVFGDDNELVGSLGSLLWTGTGNTFASAVDAKSQTLSLQQRFSDVLQKCLPKTLTQLKPLKEKLKIFLTSFVKKATAAQFLTDAESKRLMLFVDKIDLHYTKLRRSTLLQQARTFVLSGGNDTEEVGYKDISGATNSSATDSSDNSENADPNASVEDPLASYFRFVQCRVTVGTKKLVALAHSIFREATQPKTPPHCAVVLYKTARDVVDLFRAVAPVVHKDVFDTVPRKAMLFHNDCLYIAHNLLTMGYSYRSGLPPPLDSVATTADMVPAFREAAERRLSKQLQKHFAQHRAILDNLLEKELASATSEQTFDGIGEAEGLEFAQDKMQKLHGLVRKLATEIRDVAPETIYGQVIGQLLELQFTNMIQRVLAMRDISMDESQNIHDLMKNIQQQCDNLVGTEVVSEANVAVQKYCPSQKKFALITDFLDDPLATIYSKWHEDVYTPAFTKAEFSKLLKAVFNYSETREKLLKAVAESSSD